MNLRHQNLFLSVIATESKPPLSKSKASHSKPLSVAVRKGEIGKSRTLLKRYKGQLTSLSTIEREVGIGVTLGDASLQTQNGVSIKAIARR